jgi:hypothetical protein
MRRVDFGWSNLLQEFLHFLPLFRGERFVRDRDSLLNWWNGPSLRQLSHPLDLTVHEQRGVFVRAVDQNHAGHFSGVKARKCAHQKAADRLSDQ